MLSLYSWSWLQINMKFSHIGISPSAQKGPVVWLGEVSDSEYISAIKG